MLGTAGYMLGTAGYMLGTAGDMVAHVILVSPLSPNPFVGDLVGLGQV